MIEFWKSPEHKREISRFADVEKRVLEEDGATVYELTGSTIEFQIKEQMRRGKPTFYSYDSSGPLPKIINVGLDYIERHLDPTVTKKPSMLSEVAIYSDPKQFFVPETLDIENLADHLLLVEQDGEKLRRRLGLNDITEIIPNEISTLTEIAFAHFNETGKWLFGREYGKIQGEHGRASMSGITMHPILNWYSGFMDRKSQLISQKYQCIVIATVGGAKPDHGLSLNFAASIFIGFHNNMSVRLVVPKSYVSGYNFLAMKEAGGWR